MPSRSNLTTSTDIAPDKIGRCAVQSEALHSAISSHQAKLTTLVMVPRGDKTAERQREMLRLKEDYIDGHVTSAEFDAVIEHLTAAADADFQRYLDIEARGMASQAKPSDFYVSLYGYTKEQAEDLVEEDERMLDTHRTNETRARSRILQNSRNGRGH